MSPIVSDKTVSVRAPQAPKSGAALKVSSKSFSDGADIPMENVFTGCGGKNVSPQLSWSGAPSGTKSFAIGCFDPDAPTGSGYWHWVLFNLPGETTSLEAGEGNEETPRGGTTGYSDFGMNEYGGPCPPKGDGQHRYIFTVHALKIPTIGVNPDVSPAYVGFNVHFNALGSATLTATYPG